MNKNSENPKVGKTFQIAVRNWFEETYDSTFEIEQRISIGNPSKLHSFDIADSNQSVVIECKCYTWT